MSLVQHDHFLQVVKTEVQPLRMQALPMSFARTVPYGITAYDYTVHSHTLQTPQVPVAKFHYEISPMQVLHCRCCCRCHCPCWSVHEVMFPLQYL